MSTRTSDYITALAIALQTDNETYQTDNNGISFTKNLATVLASMQVSSMESITTDEEFDQKVKEKEEFLTKYLEGTKKQLNEAMQTFESYDHKGLLTKFFQKIKSRKKINQHLQTKFFDILNQYAFEAFESKTWNDVYSMFFFITVYFPTYAKPYLFLGQATEEIKGLDQASEFYKISCELLKDPDLYFLAAECEMKLAHKDKAKEYLTKIKEILGNASGLSDENQELLQETNEILELIDKEA